MNTLILDTSSNFMFVSIVQNQKETYQKVREGKNNHSEHLMNVIEEALAETSLKVKDFDRIIVGVGPGSYTGLRISMVVAKVFSWSKDIDLYTVSSLDLLGSGHFKQDGVYAITNIAKKDHVYGKVVEAKNGTIKTLHPEVFLRKEEFVSATRSFSYQEIDAENYIFSGVMIENLPLKKVEDIHPLAPNYMRKEFS